jgi:WD40 repeat protein
MILLMPTILIIPPNNMFSVDAEAIVSNPLTEDDIVSMGVEWSYVRPDNKPDGNSTSWKLRWSPDGTMIAVVYFDNTTIILDSNTGKVIQALGASANVILSSENKTSRGGHAQTRTRCWGWTNKPSVPILRSVTWSPDGKLLAVGGDHRLIEIYDTETWEVEMLLSGHEGSVLSLDWSPDGKRLASGEGTDQILPHNQAECKNYIKIWNLESKKEEHTLKGHDDGVISVSWSQNSSWLASASDDRNIKLWDVNNGTLIATLGEGIGHSAGVLDVQWSPNQTQLVSGSRDFKIRVWDLESKTPIGKPWKDHNCVRSTHWHPEGKFIATAGVDQTLKIRNATSGKEIKIFEEPGESNSEVMSARWSPDGRKIAICTSRDSTVRLYATGFEEPVTESNDWISGISIFFVICIIGLILIYIPLRKELRDRRR